jgi:hypothetical protein
MKKILTLILFAFASPTLLMYGQDWTTVSQEELNKVISTWSNKLNASKSLKIDVEMTSYNNHTTSEEEDNSKGYYVKSGNKIHSYILEAHSIINEDGMWVINDERKLIFAHGDRTKTEPVDMSFASQQGGIQTIDKSPLNGGWVYRMRFDQGLYSTVNMYFNSAGELGKVILYMSRTPQPPKDGEEAIMPRVEILLNNYSWNSSIDNARYFNMSKYLSSSSGKLLLTPQYAGYKLIDNRILN